MSTSENPGGDVCLYEVDGLAGNQARASGAWCSFAFVDALLDSDCSCMAGLSEQLRSPFRGPIKDYLVMCVAKAVNRHARNKHSQAL